MLEAEPGDYITTARKAKGKSSGSVGAVAIENGRTSQISLSFLDPGKTYVATIYADGKNAHYRNESASVHH